LDRIALRARRKRGSQRLIGATCWDTVPRVDDALLTVNEIARILKLNPQTVRNWIDRDELPAMHVGRSIRIRREDFDALIEAGYSGAQPPPPPESTIWDGVIPVPVVPAD
jgi:excisionase family DNA binding protein